tara:strand:- start:13063 stop:14877 length:1815 start_codon:yes stop_codon:yes gene_type:complete
MNQNKPSFLTTLLTWSFLIFTALFIFSIGSSVGNKAEKITMNEFMDHIENKRIKPKSIYEKENQIKAILLENSSKILAEKAEPNEISVRVDGSLDNAEYLKVLRENGYYLSKLKPSDGSFWSIFFNVVFIVLVFWMIRGAMGKGKGGVLSFGKSTHKLVNLETSSVSFEDVQGIDQAKEELVEIVDFLKNPEKYSKLGAKIPKGALLVGPPGVGKTLLAKAVAGEAKVPFFETSGSSFTEMFVGVGASRVRDLFKEAEKVAPCIIFIDEIESVGRKRGGNPMGGNSEQENTLAELLKTMDGFDSKKGIIVLAATNLVDTLDTALRRAGRFDREVYVDLPDMKGREEILKVHTRNKPLAEDVDFKVLAQGTTGMSGADLENLANEAALLAGRQQKDTINEKDFEDALAKIQLGLERKSLYMNEKERKATAYHEAGHAMIGTFYNKQDKLLPPIHKVTIVPRGKALGVTQSRPEENQISYSKKKILATISMLMGGRAAEELFLGQFTTGASDDIKKATSLAQRMVKEWGMSDLGPIRIESSNINQMDSHSQEMIKKVDEEVQKILSSQYDDALNVLKTHKTQIEKMVGVLLKNETIMGKDIDNLIG